MPRARPDLDHLLRSLYGAVSEAGWAQEFLEGLCRATRSKSAAIVATDLKKGRDSLPAWVGAEAASALVYESTYAAQNPWRGPTGPRARSAGVVLLSDDACSLQELKRTVFWSEFLKPLGLAHGAGLVGVCNPTEVASLTLLRAERAGVYGGRELALMQAVAPHWVNACLIRARLGLLADANRGLTHVLDRLATAVFLLDADGRLLRANVAGDALLSEGTCLVLKRARPTPAHGPTVAMSTAIDAATTGPDAARPMVVPLRDRAGQVRAHASAHGLAGPSFRALLFVQLLQPSRGERSLYRALREAFGLTPREADLVVRLDAGDDLGEAATRIGITTEGARTRLKSIFHKLDVHGQSDLVRLIAALRTVLGSTE